MRILVALLALVSCAGKKDEGAAATGSAANRPTPPVAVKPPPPVDAAPVPADAPEAPVEVTTKQLFADYESNEVSADNKYKGKTLMVTGIIKRIAKDPFDDKPYVELLAGDKYGINSVHASVANEAALAPLKKGNKLIMRCRGGGSSLATPPMLVDCTIEHAYEWAPK